MNTKENNTVAATELTFNFLSSMADIDAFELLRFEAQEKSVGFLKLLRQQYSTLQDGRFKTQKPKVGELPFIMALDAITRLWESKPRGEDAKFENFKDHQVKKLKRLIETGEFYTRKREIVEERLAVDIDKAEKKLAADKAKAEKAAVDAEKAKAKQEKAAAALALQEKAAAAIVQDVKQGKPVEPSIITEVKKQLTEKVIEKQAIDTIAASTLDDLIQAEQTVLETQRELDKAKEKQVKLSAPKADNNKTEPSLDFKTTNFSKDCKDTAAMILKELERDTSAAELLYLAKLILDKYNK